jgi:hypothetical protein
MKADPVVSRAQQLIVDIDRDPDARIVVFAGRVKRFYSLGPTDGQSVKIGGAGRRNVGIAGDNRPDQQEETGDDAGSNSRYAKTAMVWDHVRLAPFEAYSGYRHLAKTPAPERSEHLPLTELLPKSSQTAVVLRAGSP